MGRREGEGERVEKREEPRRRLESLEIIWRSRGESTEHLMGGMRHMRGGEEGM